MLLTPSQASLSLICFWSNISTHFLRKSGFVLPQIFRCSCFNVARWTWTKRLPIFTQTSAVAQFISWLPPSVYMICWMWRLLQWYSTCPCCEMIHLQVCLSASQASTHSFSPPLPRWAKAPHLLRLQRHRLFSHMTSLPRGGGVFPFESQPNRLWWHLCVLHESTLFSCGKYAYSAVPTMI